jgi:hypothetical protein
VIFIWPNYNTLTIYTGGIFQAETTYEIEVDKTAQDLDGNLMQHPFSFSFTTAPIGIQSSYLYFNTYILKSSVESSFRITPAIPGTFKWGTRHSSNDDKSVITFIPDREFAINTKYTVTLERGVRDMFGSYIDEPYTFAFITRPE